MTVGQAIYQEIDGNEQLRFVYQKLLIAYGAKLFGLENRLLSKEEYNQALRYADLLSKSIDTEKKEKHKLWAQEIVLLMSELYPNNRDVTFIVGSVLSSISNYAGLKIQQNVFNSGDVLDEICNEVKKNYLRVSPKQEQYFFEPQKEILNNFEKQYFSFSAPTSLGKSFAVQMFIKEKIEVGEKKNFAIIVPTKALISEVTKTFIEDLKILLLQNNYKIVNSAGATALENDRSNYIFIMTPERLLYLLIQCHEITIDYLFIDEAQKITKKDTRSTFYYQIIGILSQTSLTHITFSSPSIPNPDVYLQLVHDNPINPSKSLATTFSPVCQEKILVDLHTNNSFIFDDYFKTLMDIGPIKGDLNALIKKLGEGKRNIVYVGSKEKVVKYAIEYAATIEPINDPKLREFAKSIRRDIHPDYYLADLVEKGVAYHNGSLPSFIRSRIEELFSGSKYSEEEAQENTYGIRVLFCTSTLLEGVNLPADNLFITDYTNGSKSAMPIVEFRNLIGRVGRIKYNLYGNVIFVCLPRLSKREKFIDLLKTPIPKQILSVNSLLSDEQKKRIVKCLKSEDFILPKGKDESNEDYAMLRKFMNILLGDIIKCRNSYLLKQFSSFLSEQDINNIRIKFDDKSDDFDEDINISYDQNEALRKAILEGMGYPSIRKIDYNELVAFLNKMCTVFNWRNYEPETLGYYNKENQQFTKLKKYAVLMIEWVRGQSIREIITRTINYYKQRNRCTSKEEINNCITETFDIIENIIQFKLTNYFMKFSKMFRELYPATKFEDWYEYLEYGTNERDQIWLQRNGFTRESARYVAEHDYFVLEGESLRLRLSLVNTCENIRVRDEALQIYICNKDLFARS